ncbi:MAG: hypothetical protein AAGC93_08030 [Cyanobacteria bacterium P01_F01_bin.53]
MSYASHVLMAQSGNSTSLVQESIEQLDAIQKAWDQNWIDIFEASNGLYVGINQFAAIILVGTFIFFAVGWVKDAIERGIFPALPHVLWVFVIATLLFNNGALLGEITLGIRNVINDQTKTVLEIQVGEISMLNALNDIVVSQQAKERIQREYVDCEAKEGQAQVVCFIEAGEAAQRILETEYRNTPFWTRGIKQLWAENQARTEEIRRRYNDSDTDLGRENPLLDVLAEDMLQTTNQAIAERLLKGWQWAFSSILELAMLLTGLIGPIAVAGSTIPLQGRPIWAWLTGFFSLGLAKFSYNIIIGLAATVIVAADAQSQNTLGFLLLIGVLAPILALSIAGGAGMAVFRGVSGGVTRLISVGTSTLPFPR